MTLAGLVPPSQEELLQGSYVPISGLTAAMRLRILPHVALKSPSFQRPRVLSRGRCPPTKHVAPRPEFCHGIDCDTHICFITRRCRL